MGQMKVFSYRNQVISQREDGFVNLTQMCQINGKRLDHFMKSNKTKEYICSLENSLQMGVVESVQGNTRRSGTWAHPSLAVNLARWISSDFAVWCDAHIFNLMTFGQTSLDADPLEEMKLKLELFKAEKELAIAQSQIHTAEKNLLDTRHYIATALPEPIQQKVLGYQLVKEVEKIPVVIDKSTGEEFDGVGITYIAKTLGFKNNQQCWAWLEKKGFGKDSEKWHNELTAINSQKLPREDLEYLKDIFKEEKYRQLWLGE